MSEVPIEKIVAEINGFRQRLAMLKDELIRSNRAMAEKITQLGETLTQRVRELRDQVTNTPQNIVALESRFMSGEIPEADYKAQREEHRGQLQKSLRSIDEIRSLLAIMSQLEARPTGPPSSVGRPSPVSG